MRTIKKNNNHKTTPEIQGDIQMAFDILLKENEKRKSKFYHAVIKQTEAKHDRDLSFMLTNKLFNRLNKETQNTFEVLNYIFVVEYSKVNSLGLRVTNDLGMHSHIAISSTLPKELIHFYIQSTFPRSRDIYFEDVSGNTNKEGLARYFLKQKYLLCNDGYNYKITLST